MATLSETEIQWSSIFLTNFLCHLWTYLLETATWCRLCFIIENNATRIFSRRHYWTKTMLGDI